ncbi:MAG: hypothetical protein K8R36_16235, partial [Planctomycetales bacterium]|nr:hypothetical protein [Planctomycetales bacterium]
MLHQRLVWCCAVVFSLTVGRSVDAAKPQEKSPLLDENSRAAELVKIGLEAELAGNSESRNLHLKAALDIEPEYPAANWQLGMVRLGEEWLPVPKAAEAISKTSQYSWYRSKRMELDGSVKKELALARWCEQEGMKDRSQFHYARLLQNPAIDLKVAKEAAAKVELVAYQGQLCSRAQVAELDREAKVAEEAWNTWERKFAGFRGAFEGKNTAKRERAHEELLGIKDIHVTPLVDSHLSSAGEDW